MKHNKEVIIIFCLLLNLLVGNSYSTTVEILTDKSTST